VSKGNHKHILAHYQASSQSKPEKELQKAKILFSESDSH